MARLSRALALAGLLCGALFAEPVAARSLSSVSPTVINAKRREALKRWELAARGPDAGNARRDEDKVAPPRVKNITFTNPKASQFYVDGTTIPEVDFNAGPSWSGLIPISSAANETRKLFFWFFPLMRVGGPKRRRAAARSEVE
ncbi:hypothetical protein BC834DRAFT_967969 [Gloeopeniophorella convolvens]|nr:hypothetical protein BC834DRAFT_967969 [Gloeopeniophorella convolvens]